MHDIPSYRKLHGAGQTEVSTHFSFLVFAEHATDDSRPELDGETSISVGGHHDSIRHFDF